ncbi:MAG TPA: glycosyltransferase family 39 protein [Anaerolineales bacterium]|nr:glycosyltransferase family 39 protein [Anaerolineales bacterium]
MIIRSSFWRDNAGLFIALALAVVLKALLLALDAFPFNADEAVVALMARHILQGERPAFFYGQAYLGSTDAWLIAGAFLIFGQRVLAIRIVQAALYLGTIATTYLLGLKVFANRWVATASALLLAAPTVLVTLYTTATLGGYGETLLIGNILLLWTLRLREKSRPYIEWLSFGVLAGFGFWTFGFLGVYLVPIGAALIFHHREHGDHRELKSKFLLVNSVVSYFLALLGFAVGSSPWWWATLFGAATVSELGGAAIAGASQQGPVTAIAFRIFGLFVLGLPVVVGIRPPWAVRWLALPLALVAIPVFIGAVIWLARTSRSEWPKMLLGGVCLTLIVAFVFTPFGNDPSGRYFLPLMPPLALFTADLLNWIRREYPRAALGLLAAMLAFNLWGNLDSAFTFPPGITTQFDGVAQVNMRDMPAVMDFLLEHGETRGYSNYWVTFPMAFLSNEKLIYSAALPYHLDFRYTPRYDRYAPYREAVAASDRVAYITTRHPALDERLRAGLNALGVSYAEAAFGDYHIFYQLSRRVTPDEVGIYRRDP